MEQYQVVYVEASESDPKASEIDEACQKMAELGFALRHVAPSQGEGGMTVGLWLFFAGPDPATRALERAQAEVTPATWWQEVRDRKALGASLTLTGVASVVVGTVVHFALRNDIIDTTLHLGYFFGVVGLLLFLIGLLIVY
jgi:hypothetical protein